jgi:PDZ domain-containing protein
MAGWGPSVRDNAMSTSEITLPPSVSAETRRRRRMPVVLVVVGVLLVALFIVASVITVPYDELVPGQAQAVSRLITVPPGKGHPLHGEVLLTDVGLIENLHLIALLPAWLDGDATLVKTVDLTGNLPEAEFNDQGTVDMEESQLTAKSVALRQLGYAVPEHDVGATVYGIEPGTPGYRVLTVGDVITAVDGVATPNPDALVAAIRSHAPGQTVTLTVGSIAHPTPGRSVALRLASGREDGKTVPLVGIVGMGTQPEYDFPFPITINSDQIGGPSAGLAWTLGIINSLSGGRLTGGLTIAASGTIRPDGSVGDVGGLEQKTVAVERAGATVFFVPNYPDSVDPARAKATANLKVFPVSSLGQALRELEKLGGHLGPAAVGPAAGPAGHAVPYNWQDSPWS